MHSWYSSAYIFILLMQELDTRGYIIFFYL
nr:MAG TPA: hypothetical protein [Crassvirales sp.]